MIKSGLPPIHPGEFLLETLQDLRVSQARFARAIGVSPMRISHVTGGARPVTAELALLFGKALGQSPQYWLNLQADYDLKLAERSLQKRVAAISVLEPRLGEAVRAPARGRRTVSAQPSRGTTRKRSA